MTTTGERKSAAAVKCTLNKNKTKKPQGGANNEQSSSDI